MKKLLNILIVFAVLFAALGVSAVGSPVQAAGLPKPTLSSPGNGSSWSQSTVIELKWNSVAGATQYKVELWGGPYATMVPCNWVSGTSCQIGTMWPGTMNWHVKARNATGEGDWSDTWSFVIQGNGTPPPSGTPTPPPYTRQFYTETSNCIPESATSTFVDDDNGRHFYIDLVIKNGTVIKDLTLPRQHPRAYADNFWLQSAILVGGELDVQEPGTTTVPGNVVPPDTWRVIIYERGLLTGASLIRHDFDHNPGSLVHLMCEYKKETLESKVFYLLHQFSIVSSKVGDRFSQTFNVQSWMKSIFVIERKNSNATITLRGPDGTIYNSSHPQVEYTDTPQYSVLKLNQPTEGQWEVLIDVTAVQPDSVFLVGIGGTYGDGTNADILAPFTNITIEATHGTNSWLVSDARISLSADDAGGSGVAKTEWSIDEGASWNEYSAPVIITQEGLTVFTARATDNAGNVEILPPTKYLRIDKTPPSTTLALDGTLGNNGWYVSNVTGSLSATDNMSGVGATFYSIDGGSITPGTAFTLENDGIHTIQFYSQDNAGNIEPSQTATIKVDKTPPVVTPWTDQTEYTRVQPFVVHYTCTDPQPGSGIASCTATFNNQPVQDGQSMDLFWLDLGSYLVNARGEDYAGWVTTKSASFQLIATIESLQATVDRLCKENYITNKGVCNSLRQKLDAALAARNRGQTNTAVNILQALQNEVNAQTGKAIKPEAARMLLMDSSYVIQSLR